MAPIRRRPGTTNNEDNNATLSGHHYKPDPLNNIPGTGNQQPVQSVDDSVSHHIEELYILVDIHEKEMRECIDRLKTRLQHPEVDMHRSLHQVSSGVESSQSLAARVQPQVTTCLNCNALPATMVCYPCRHFSLCLECDAKVSECPLCKNIKISSFMPNQSST